MSHLRALPLAMLILALTPAYLSSDASPTATAASVAAGQNQFAFDLYDRLRVTPGNLCFSPICLATGLSMTYAGAAGKTAEEMRSVLHTDSAGDTFHDACGDLIGRLEEGAGSGSYRLSLPNRLWGNAGYRFLDPFLRITLDQYKAELVELDFGGDVVGSARTINDWVSQRTEGRIQDLVTEASLDRPMILLLTSAIYFRGFWEMPFDSAATRSKPFHLDRDSTIEVPTMIKSAPFPVSQRVGFAVLQLPYRGDDLSMIVLLPDSIDGLPALEARLSPSEIDACVASLSEHSILVNIPRFRLRSRFELNAALADLGMPSAFGASADFSGMNGRHDLYISLVAHSAFVEVDETGTVAAAATGVWGKLKGLDRRPETFIADHPFLFLIRDERTGSILFLGRVSDPSKPGA